MAQDFKSTGNKPKESEKGAIKPDTMTTVYSASKDTLNPNGTPLEVHTSLAEKLIASGKAAKTEEEALKTGKAATKKGGE